MGTGLQGLVILNVSAYEPRPWHGTLIVIGVGCFAVFFNTFLSKKLPLVEGMILVLHVAGLFAIMIPLLVLAPKSNSKTVFTELTNNGGWSTDGVSFMVGLNPIVVSLLGFDSTVHMCKCQSFICSVLTNMLSQRRCLTAEETRGAATTLPRSIMWSTVLNSALGLAMVLTVCYTWGDMDELRETPTGYPFIQIFYNATQSLAGTSVMTIIVLITLLGSTIAVAATASRQIWSFSRDKGVPYSSIVSQVSYQSHGLTI